MLRFINYTTLLLYNKCCIINISSLDIHLFLTLIKLSSFHYTRYEYALLNPINYIYIAKYTSAIVLINKRNVGNNKKTNTMITNKNTS